MDYKYGETRHAIGNLQKYDIVNLEEKDSAKEMVPSERFLSEYAIYSAEELEKIYKIKTKEGFPLMETKQLHKGDAHKAFRFLVTVLAISGLFSFALAEKVTVPDTVDATSMLGTFIGFVLDIVTLAGVGVLIWGIVQFAMSMPAHDLEEKDSTKEMIPSERFLSEYAIYSAKELAKNI